MGSAQPRTRRAPPMSSIELSVRVSWKQGSLRESRQAIVDQLAGYKRLGLTHVVLDFRRDSLAEMLEALDMVATEIRPAVDRRLRRPSRAALRRRCQAGRGRTA